MLLALRLEYISLPFFSREISAAAVFLTLAMILYADLRKIKFWPFVLFPKAHAVTIFLIQG